MNIDKYIPRVVIAILIFTSGVMLFRAVISAFNLWPFVRELLDISFILKVNGIVFYLFLTLFFVGFYKMYKDSSK